MSIQSFNRSISSLFLSKSLAFSRLTRFTLSTVADKYYAHFINHPQNPEKTLIKINAELNALCVIDVLNRFSIDNPQLGLRFFIWAGLQSKYRHTNYLYRLACNVLDIRQKPGLIREVFEAYRVEGCVVNVKLFKVVMNLCKEARIVGQSLWVLRRIEEFGCRPDLTMFNVVIGLLCDEGEVDEAVELMREMEERGLCPDMITYMAMIKGFCDVGRFEDACMLFKTMRSHGCVPSTVAFSSMLDGFCRRGHFERALELLGEMEKEGGECAPNVISYTSVIQRLCENSKSVEALSVLDRMERFNCAPNQVTISVLVNGLCAEGSIDEAYSVVGRVTAGGYVRSGECYSSLVVALLRIKRLVDAEKLFRWMLNSSMRPNGLACSLLMRYLCAVERFLDAFHTFEDVHKKGFVLTIESDIYSVLLVGLRRQMHMTEAAKLANLMVEKGIPVNDSHIDDFKKHLKGSCDGVTCTIVHS